MTNTQWLLDLVEEATPENLGPNDSTATSGDAWLLLAGLAPDLARLVCLAAAPDKWDEFLARLAELKP